MRSVAWTIPFCFLIPGGLSCAQQPMDLGRYSIAIIPFEVTGGKTATLDLVLPSTKDAFELGGLKVTCGVPVLKGIDFVTGFEGLGQCTKGLLPTEACVALGRALKVGYVVVGDINIVSKRTIHIFGPRAKGKCYLITRVVDVNSGEVVFSTEETRQDKEDPTGQIIVGAVLWYPGGWLMSGSTGEKERKALTEAIGDAYRPFFQRLSQP